MSNTAHQPAVAGPSSSSASRSPLPSHPSIVLTSHNSPSPVPASALHLAVRFSSITPPLELFIADSNATRVITLKHNIRARLTEPESQRRLRIVHGGRVLSDETVLSSVFKSLAPPPRASLNTPSKLLNVDSEDGTGKGKGKGKETAHDDQDGVDERNEVQRAYVHCFLGNSLTTQELEAEAIAATTTAPKAPHPSNKPHPQSLNLDTSHTPTTLPSTNHARLRAITTAPRGFDRLLASPSTGGGPGFTPSEVRSLRLQFTSIQASRYTADTMPSPDTLRAMEDAWIDSDNLGGGASYFPSTTTGEGEDGGEEGDGGGVGGGGGGGLDGESGMDAMDHLLFGMAVGFVWPLGSVGWLLRGRAEKIPKRMKVFVWFGFSLIFVIGLVRAMG